MVSKYSDVLVLNGNGISNISGSRQPPKSDCRGGSEVSVRRPNVPAVAGAATSSPLPPRSVESCSTTVQAGSCSIPSCRRDSCTPTLMCNGRGCLEADQKDGLKDRRPHTANNSTRPPSSPHLFTSLRSTSIINDQRRLRTQLRYRIFSRSYYCTVA